MRRELPGVLLGVVMAVVLSGCIGPEQPVTNGDLDMNTPEYVFTYAENQAEDYPTTQGAYKFAELISQKTNGRILINVQAGGVLGDEKSVCEQLQFGGIDFMRMSLSPLAEFVPKLNVLQLPYLYRDADHMWQVLDGAIGRDFMNSLKVPIWCLYPGMMLVPEIFIIPSAPSGSWKI